MRTKRESKFSFSDLQKYTCLLVIIFGLIPLLACGGGGGNGDPVPTLNISGYWDVYHTESGGTEEGPEYTTITQTGDSLSGSWTCESGMSNANGSIEGLNITFSWQDGIGITTNVTGTVSSDGNSISGTYKDSTGVSGSWRAIKRSEAPPCATAFNSIKVYAGTGRAYEVWVGNESYFGYPGYWNYYYSISNHNFFKKGEAANGGVTNVNGKFKYYVIAVPEEAYIDAIQLGEANYLSPSNNWDWGNLTANESNIYGAPDNAYATVGLTSGQSGGIYNGYVVLENTAYQLPAISKNYQVWGGSTYIWGSDGYDPGAHGYILLGQSTTTATFNGSYLFYLIKVGSNAEARIDAVGGSKGQYYGTGTTGNTQRYERVNGAPDGKSALVGLHIEGGYYGGYILIAPSDSPSSINVYIGN